MPPRALRVAATLHPSPPPAGWEGRGGPPSAGSRMWELGDWSAAMSPPHRLCGPPSSDRIWEGTGGEGHCRPEWELGRGAPLRALRAATTAACGGCCRHTPILLSNLGGREGGEGSHATCFEKGGG